MGDRIQYSTIDLSFVAEQIGGTAPEAVRRFNRARSNAVGWLGFGGGNGFCSRAAAAVVGSAGRRGRNPVRHRPVGAVAPS